MALVEARDRQASGGGLCVYFITSGFGRAARVKIGKCTGHPKARLAQLQTGSAEPLRLEAFIAAAPGTEREMHSIYAAYRLRRRSEWFRREGELFYFLKDLREAIQVGAALREQLAHFALAVAP